MVPDRNSMNQLMLNLLAILLLGGMAPAAFAKEAKEINSIQQQVCERKGYYKLVIKNGWDDKKFPLYLRKAVHWIPSGITETHEVSKGELDRFFTELGRMGITLDVASLLSLSRNDLGPTSIHYMSDDCVPEDEKFSLDFIYCLKGKCDVKKHSAKNCDGYVILHVIKGHHHSTREELIKWSIEHNIPYVL